MKKWQIENKHKISNVKLKDEDLIKILLENRGIKTKQDVEKFLHPKLSEVTAKAVKIDANGLKKALARIKQAIESKEKIIVFGDYDVDGICGTAILWEALNAMGANVLPYVPSRFEQGYGSSEKEIENLVPLTGANQVVVYYGLQKLRETKRVGLLSLFNKSGIIKEEIGTYEIGHVIAPRLNAMGRLASAMDSLRLICTSDKNKSEDFANLLNETNLERQQFTKDALAHAKNKIEKEGLKSLIFIADESYQQGIVGLVA